MSDKNFDVVVYGATGFTGKLVVEYMLNQYGNDESITWAMAGRSHEKLIAVRDALGVSQDVALLTVDSNNETVTNTNQYNGAGSASEIPVASAVAPSLMSGGNDSCLKSVSGGVSTLQIGISSGKYVEDEEGQEDKIQIRN